MTELFFGVFLKVNTVAFQLFSSCFVFGFFLPLWELWCNLYRFHLDRRAAAVLNVPVQFVFPMLLCVLVCQCLPVTQVQIQKTQRLPQTTRLSRVSNLSLRAAVWPVTAVFHQAMPSSFALSAPKIRCTSSRSRRRTSSGDTGENECNGVNTLQVYFWRHVL